MGRGVARPGVPPDPRSVEGGMVKFTEHPHYLEMKKRFPLLKALREGDEAMRTSEWLPPHPGEGEHHKDRVALTHLFGAYDDAVSNISGRPFSREVRLRDMSGDDEERPLPERFESFASDVDRQGTSLTDFAAAVFEDGVQFGLSHVLTNTPAGAVELRPGLDPHVRPYWLHISAEHLFDWVPRTRDNGGSVLSEIRWYDQTFVPSSGGGLEERRVVHEVKEPTHPDPNVLDRYQRGEVTDQDFARTGGKAGTWARYVQESASSTEFALGPEGTHDFRSIPIETFYTCRKAPMLGRPCLWSLAQANLHHLRLMSDQDQELSTASVSLLLLAGFSAKEVKAKQAVGPFAMVSTTNEKADGKMVEHSGEATSARANQIEAVQKRMETLGAKPEVRQHSVTATGELIEEDERVSDTVVWARRLESMLNASLQRMTALLPDLEKRGLEMRKIDVFDKFGGPVNSGDATVLKDVFVARGLAPRDLQANLKRLGLLSDDHNLDEALERLEAWNSDEGSVV